MKSRILLIIFSVAFLGLQVGCVVHEALRTPQPVSVNLDVDPGYFAMLPLELSNHIKVVSYGMCGLACSDVDTIYITKELLATCDNYEEFLFSVMHEEAHIVLGHVHASTAMHNTPEGYNEAAFNVMSRSQEYQADLTAARYMKGNGYTIKSCSILKELNTSLIETTHPSSEKRYAECVKVWE